MCLAPQEFHGRDVATRARDYTDQLSSSTDGGGGGGEETTPAGVPATLVAAVGEWVVGSVALVEDDTEVRSSQTWVLSLTVLATHSSPIVSWHRYGQHERGCQSVSQSVSQSVLRMIVPTGLCGAGAIY